MGKARSPATTREVTLDAGALIALDRGSPRMIALLEASVARGATFHVPAGVVGQAWRDGRRQSNLARFLRTKEVEVHPLDGAAARACGELCRAARTHDVIDASVVLVTREHHAIVLSSDPGDLRRLDPTLEAERI